jgi:hypothetical protein
MSADIRMIREKAAKIFSMPAIFRETICHTRRHPALETAVRALVDHPIMSTEGLCNQKPSR